MYFFVSYSIIFSIFVIDNIIGIVQLVNYSMEGFDLLATSEGQFRLINLITNLITTCIAIIALTIIWRKIVIQIGEGELVKYRRIFKIIFFVGIVNFLFPFLIFINRLLKTTPFGQIYNILVKLSLIFLLLGSSGILSINVEERKINNIN